MAKKKKKGKKGKTGKKGKKGSNGSSEKGKKDALTNDQVIAKSISDHIQIIDMIWKFILDDTLTEDDLKREKLHKARCKADNVPYSPRYSIPFERFKTVIESVTDIALTPETKPNQKLGTMLDVFEWFDMGAQGTVSYKEFQQRMGEFFLDENKKAKPTKKVKAKAKKKGKKKKK